MPDLGTLNEANIRCPPYSQLTWLLSAEPRRPGYVSQENDNSFLYSFNVPTAHCLHV